MRKILFLVVVGFALSLFVNVGIFNQNNAVAANKQGGGAFNKPAKKVKKRRSVRKSKTKRRAKKKVAKRRKKAPVPRHNYNGSYSIVMVLQTRNTKFTCRGGTKKFVVSNNAMTMKTWALGDTVSGRVSGGTLRLQKSGVGVLSNMGVEAWDWSGTVKLPRGKGQTSSGTFRGKGKTGGCVWRMDVRRL